MKGRFSGLWRRKTATGAVASNRKPTRQARRRKPAAGRFEPLESRELLTVTYQGGALLTNVETQAVYLGSDWGTNSTLQAQEKNTDQYLSALVGGSYMDMLNNAGYGVGRGTASTGVVDSIGINKSVDLTDTQIQTDLKTLISSSGSGLQAPDANRLYMVYVEPGVVVQMGSATSQTSFLGYHGAFADGNSVIHYAVMPGPGSPNPTPSSQGFGSAFDELTSVSSHELAEAVTDPNVNFSTMGWYDFQLNGEIGDLAEGHESTITGPTGAQYVVQDVVNKNDQVISPATSQPTPTPTPGLTAPSLTASAVSTTVAQLSWTAVSGTQGYRVYQINGGQAVLLGTVSATTTSVQVSGLTPGASESFKVEAYNSTSVADSSIVNLTMPAPAVQAVTAPHVTAQAVSSTSVAVSWNAEPQASGYKIYWSNGYSVVLLGTVSATTSSVTITGLQPGSGSYFLVEAYNSTSYADSQWAYAATPYYSTISSGGWGAYAQAQSNDWGVTPAVTPSGAPETGGHHWGRGYEWN